jgi:hypothetical protein
MVLDTTCPVAIVVAKEQLVQRSLHYTMPFIVRSILNNLHDFSAVMHPMYPDALFMVAFAFVSFSLSGNIPVATMVRMRA